MSTADETENGKAMQLTGEALSLYNRLRERGMSEAHCLRVASETYPDGHTFVAPKPRIQTDKQFMRGLAHHDEFAGNSARRAAYEEAARAAGVNPSGKKYSGQLARFPMDPEGWYDSAGDVRGKLRSRGWGGTGVGIHENCVEPDVPNPLDGPYRVSPDIVAEEIETKLGQAGVKSLGEREYNDLFEKTSERLSGKTPTTTLEKDLFI